MDMLEVFQVVALMSGAPLPCKLLQTNLTKRIFYFVMYTQWAVNEDLLIMLICYLCSVGLDMLQDD